MTDANADLEFSPINDSLGKRMKPQNTKSRERLVESCIGEHLNRQGYLMN